MRELSPRIEVRRRPERGIYDVGRDEIAALAWDGLGQPAHPRLPRAAGLCGAAVSAGRPIVVGDVAADARYLQLLERRAALISPLWRLVGDNDPSATAEAR